MVLIAQVRTRSLREKQSHRAYQRQNQDLCLHLLMPHQGFLRGSHRSLPHSLTRPHPVPPPHFSIHKKPVGVFLTQEEGIILLEGQVILVSLSPIPTK